jgi:pimeloyl-ACP methyl ester carboxylesterase
MVAVLDALGCERAVLLGLSAPAGLLFAATHPERTKALVLVNPYARLCRADGYPEGFPDDFVDRTLSLTRERWATGWSLQRLAPSMWWTSRWRGTGRLDDATLRSLELRNIYDVDGVARLVRFGSRRWWSSRGCSRSAGRYVADRSQISASS